MATPYIIILLATGIITGFASGLLGVGGAFITTPVQYTVFTNMGISPEIAIKLAFCPQPSVEPGGTTKKGWCGGKLPLSWVAAVR